LADFDQLRVLSKNFWPAKMLKRDNFLHVVPAARHKGEQISEFVPVDKELSRRRLQKRGKRE
jgi:IS4 transposase